MLLTILSNLCTPLAQIAAMAPHRTAACRFGIKRDRRKLHIEPLHLPPEDSRASKYQSETSLGVKQDSKNAATPLHTHGITQSSMLSHQSAGGGSVISTSGVRGISQINIHGNDASRHAPSDNSSTSPGGTLCASTLPSASIRLTKNLDF